MRTTDTAKRRRFLKYGLTGVVLLVSGALFSPSSLVAAETIKMLNYAYVLGIHSVPNKGLEDELGNFGYKVEMVRMPKTRDIVQNIIGGSADLAAVGVILPLRAIQQGAGLTIFGNYYLHTSLVLVVNSKFIKSWKDVQKSEVSIAVNSEGDITHTMFVGALLKAGVDVDKVKFVSLGGSGSRTRALISNRVQATVVHFDQVPKIQKTGDFKILTVVAKEYDPWINEVLVTRTDWLKKPENRKKAVAVMKAIITASRKATKNYSYYKDAFLKYSTARGKKDMPDDKIRAYHSKIATDFGVWPANNSFKASNIEKLLPFYRKAKALGPESIDLNKAVDTSIVEQALRELG